MYLASRILGRLREWGTEMTQTETPKWQSKTTQVPWRVGIYSDIPVTKFDFYRKISQKKIWDQENGQRCLLPSLMT